MLHILWAARILLTGSNWRMRGPILKIREHSKLKCSTYLNRDLNSYLFISLFTSHIKYVIVSYSLLVNKQLKTKSNSKYKYKQVPCDFKSLLSLVGRSARYYSRDCAICGCTFFQPYCRTMTCVILRRRQMEQELMALSESLSSLIQSV